MPTLPNAALWRDAANPTAGRWYQRGPEILADQGSRTIERNAPRGTAQVTLVAVVEPGVHALADARLIAAAKDLRAALVDLTAAFANTDSDDLPQLIAAHEALAKSEGR